MRYPGEAAPISSGSTDAGRPRLLGEVRRRLRLRRNSSPIEKAHVPGSLVYPGARDVASSRT